MKRIHCERKLSAVLAAIVMVACLLPTVSSPARAAYSPSTEGLFAGKYGKAQIFDCQRSPAYPNMGATVRVSGFKNIYNDVGSGQFPDSIWGEASNRYVQFADISGGNNNGNAALKLYEADGTYVQNVSDGGTVYALSNEGFLFIGSNHDYGYFISNAEGFAYGSNTSYTANTGKVTDTDTLISYEATTTVLDVGEKASGNVAPTFVGPTGDSVDLTVKAGATDAIDIGYLLHVSDEDSSQTLTWTESSAPSHGALSFTSATAGSGGTDTSPAENSIMYTPDAGLSDGDTDSFAVQVSDGTDTAMRTISVTADGIAPAVSSIEKYSPSSAATKDNSVVFRVTFSEAVTDVDAGDFSLAGESSGTITSVSAQSGSVYDVTVKDISGDGTLGLDLNDSGTDIADTVGNAITGGYTGGQEYTIDMTPPTVSDAQVSIGGAATGAGGVYKIGDTVTVSWDNTSSGDYNGDVDAVTVDFSAFGGGSAVPASESSGIWTASYTVIPGSINSTSQNVSITVTDEAGNQTSIDDATIAAVDNTIPEVSSIEKYSPSSTATKDNSVVFRVTFNEAVTGVDAGDFSLTGSSSGTIASVSAHSGSVYHVTVTDIPADGTVGLDLNDSGTDIADTAGNTITGGYTGGEKYTIDTIAPTVADAQISISGATGADGEYKIGDTVTVIWDNTSLGDNNSDVGAVTVDFSAFGGGSAVPACESSGIWTATYTITPGTIESAGQNVTVTVTDDAGNETSIADTTDAAVNNIAPTITSTKVAPNYSYVDVIFSEGVYGGTGASPLDANDFVLNFLQNDGAATSATIRSVTKNDSISETSASALTGGETVVRIFLNVTGTPSGVEAIEITPADGTSIYNAVGNTLGAGETTGAVEPRGASSGGGHSSSSSNKGAAVEVNGESYTVGESETSTNKNGQTQTTVTVSTDKLQNILESSGAGAIVTLPITTESEVAQGILSGEMVNNMEKNGATLLIRTKNAMYTLPATEIDINDISKQFGKDVSLSNIAVTVAITEPSLDRVRVVENAAEDGGFELIVPAIDFTISCEYSGQTAQVSNFNTYVKRLITLPGGVDPNKITTGIAVNPDGSVRHVPTYVTKDGDTYYAVINSLTNSMYSVIWHPVEFADVTASWAKDAVNDMGSRMIVTGVSENAYGPDRSVTRAEFSAILVRALGLAPGNGVTDFADVVPSAWYAGYVETAASYGLIKGYDSGNFGPNDAINREQAMTMLTRAMKLTGLTTGTSEMILTQYGDASDISSYAQENVEECVSAGLIVGRSSNTLAPKEGITRAEAAVIIQRLLQNSGLID